MGNLALALLKQGKVPEAEALRREALRLCRETLGDEHQTTLGAIDNLAIVLFGKGAIDEVIALSREGLETRRRLFGDAHAGTRGALLRVSAALLTKGAWPGPALRYDTCDVPSVLDRAPLLKLW